MRNQKRRIEAHDGASKDRRPNEIHNFEPELRLPCSFHKDHQVSAIDQLFQIILQATLATRLARTYVGN